MDNFSPTISGVKTTFIDGFTPQTGQLQHKLIILDGMQTVQEIDLDSFRESIINFGRHESCDILLHSDIVSRLHGYIERTYDGYVIHDNNSVNGLLINGAVYSGCDDGLHQNSHFLRDGDVIRIDNHSFSTPHNKGVLMMYTTMPCLGQWTKCMVAGKSQINIGRADTSDIFLDNINVSRNHAAITLQNGQYFIHDTNSLNGILVNGRRVLGSQPLNEKDVIMISNSILIFTSGVILYKGDRGGTNVEMRGIFRTVKFKGNEKCILNNVNLKISPNEFVAIIGGSGAGKSTVMNAMSGFERATEGSVMVNGVDLYNNYSVLKNMIGYVPQQDIIYENLSLYRMLYYTAKMRMPKDVSSDEREKRIAEVLEMVELTEHKDSAIKSLSGGQKKRASIAVELLADPKLFFLDEPTSGLDPGTEASLMKTLNALSKDKDKTIIMVTHTTQNLHLCDKILFMGKGGKVCFYGSPAECLNFFGVSNLADIYNKVLTDQEVAYWSNKYKKEFNNAAMSVSNKKEASSGKVKTSAVRQFLILASRYSELIKNDVQRLLMVVLQPILIAILLTLVADDDVFTYYSSTRSILFALSSAGIWMGLFNSIQEICKERNILKREYMANLMLGSYIMSKFIVQLVISMIQAFIMILIFTIMVGRPDKGIFISGFFDMVITMCLTIYSSAAIGFIVSAISKNSDKAMTVAPFLLIIQLLFSGILFELTGVTEALSYITVSKWSVSAFSAISDLNNLPINAATKAPIPEEDIVELFDHTISAMGSSWAVLFGFITICFISCIILLRNVSKDSR